MNDDDHQKTASCCADWQPGIDNINSIITMIAARSGNPSIYTGKQFVFCPWCGAKKKGPDVPHPLAPRGTLYDPCWCNGPWLSEYRHNEYCRERRVAWAKFLDGIDDA